MYIFQFSFKELKLWKLIWLIVQILVHMHGSTPIYIRDLFDEKDKIYNLHSTVSLKQPKCDTVTYGLNTFQ